MAVAVVDSVAEVVTEEAVVAGVDLGAEVVEEEVPQAGVAVVEEEEVAEVAWDLDQELWSSPMRLSLASSSSEAKMILFLPRT